MTQMQRLISRYLGPDQAGGAVTKKGTTCKEGKLPKKKLSWRVP